MFQREKEKPNHEFKLVSVEITVGGRKRDDENVTMAKFSVLVKLLPFFLHIICNLWWLRQKQTAMSRLSSQQLQAS